MAVENVDRDRQLSTLCALGFDACWSSSFSPLSRLSLAISIGLPVPRFTRHDYVGADEARR